MPTVYVSVFLALLSIETLSELYITLCVDCMSHPMSHDPHVDCMSHPMSHDPHVDCMSHPISHDPHVDCMSHPMSHDPR